MSSLAQQSDGSLVKSDFSNYGQSIYFAAPGTHIVSAALSGTGSDLTYMNGTSMAAPHVAAAVATACAIESKCTDKTVLPYLQNMVEYLGYSGKDKYYGYGIIRFDFYDGNEVANTIDIKVNSEDPSCNTVNENYWTLCVKQGANLKLFINKEEWEGKYMAIKNFQIDDDMMSYQKKCV